MVSILKGFRKAQFVVLLKAFAICGVAFIAIALFSQRYRIAYDPQVTTCIPNTTLLLIDLKDKAIVQNGLYAFKAKHAQPVYEDGTLMAKFVRGVEGDDVEIAPDFDITVNGVLYGHGLPYLAKATPDEMKRFIGKRKLKAGELWLMGTSPRSFDSRYWGVATKEQIIGRAYVLF